MKNKRKETLKRIDDKPAQNTLTLSNVYKRKMFLHFHSRNNFHSGKDPLG